MFWNWRMKAANHPELLQVLRQFYNYKVPGYTMKNACARVLGWIKVLFLTVTEGSCGIPQPSLQWNGIWMANKRAQEHVSKQLLSMPLTVWKQQSSPKYNPYRAIKPCGSGLWYPSFSEIVVAIYSSLRVLIECLYQQPFVPDTD